MLLRVEFTTPQNKTKVLAGIIRRVESTPYSHVRLRWTNSQGVNIVYEASGSEVKFIGPLAQQTNKVDIVYSYIFSLNQEQYKDLVRICMTYAGVSYGSLQLVGMFLARVFNLKSNPLSSGTKTLVCSELVIKVLVEVLKAHIPSTLNTDLASPRDIKLLLDRPMVIG